MCSQIFKHNWSGLLQLSKFPCSAFMYSFPVISNAGWLMWHSFPHQHQQQHSRIQDTSGEVLFPYFHGQRDLGSRLSLGWSGVIERPLRLWWEDPVIKFSCRRWDTWHIQFNQEIITVINSWFNYAVYGEHYHILGILRKNQISNYRASLFSQNSI